jgi:two-component system, NarL family, response regulator DegU
MEDVFLNLFLIHRFPILLEELYLMIRKVFTCSHIHRLKSLQELNSNLINNGDILIIYIETTGPNLLKVLNKLKQKGVKIILLIESKEEKYLKYLLQQKFFGYLCDIIRENDISDALRMIQNNKPYLHPDLSSLLLDEYIKDHVNKVKPSHFSLTKREWEVLQLIAMGFNNDNVAKRLFLTESTVKNHVSSILKKLDVPDRTSAVITAYKNKWIHY